VVGAFALELSHQLEIAVDALRRRSAVRSATVDCPCTPVSGLSLVSQVAFTPSGGGMSSSPPLQLIKTMAATAINALMDNVLNHPMLLVVSHGSPTW